MQNTKAPKLAAVLLAAGASRRLGRSKQFIRLDGKSLVKRSAELLLAAGADPVVVVAGFRWELVSKELQSLPLTIAVNEDWEQGMGGSIARGVREIPSGVDGVLVMLCDLWKLDLPDLRLLKATWISDISQIIVSEWNDEKTSNHGPPVIFPGKLIHELKCVDGDTGAKALIDRHKEIVSEVRLENAAYDLDDPQDIDQFLNSTDGIS